jgi:glycosyltransferase involved in cell wall biosynthesis
MMDGGLPWPSVSVVTPSFNQGRFLEETIRSVLLQGYPSLEYIVMDGGSTDESVDILRRYEPWLAHWQSGKDGGQSEAINRGWDRSHGEFLAWLNSDDAYRAGAIARAVNALREHPAVGAVYGKVSICDEETRPTGKFGGRPFDLGQLFWGRNPVAQPATFLRRSVLEQTGTLDESLHFVMDHELWIRVARRMPIIFVDEVWADFRLYPGSKSGSGLLKRHRELHEVLTKVCVGPDSDGLARVANGGVRSLLARSHLRVAVANHRLDRTAEARSAALRAFGANPFLLMKGRDRRDLVRCLVGERPARVLRTMLRRSSQGRH